MAKPITQKNPPKKNFFVRAGNAFVATVTYPFKSGANFANTLLFIGGGIGIFLLMGFFFGVNPISAVFLCAALVPAVYLTNKHGDQFCDKFLDKLGLKPKTQFAKKFMKGLLALALTNIFHIIPSLLLTTLLVGLAMPLALPMVVGVLAIAGTIMGVSTFVALFAGIALTKLIETASLAIMASRTKNKPNNGAAPAPGAVPQATLPTADTNPHATLVVNTSKSQLLSFKGKSTAERPAPGTAAPSEELEFGSAKKLTAYS